MSLLWLKKELTNKGNCLKEVISLLTAADLLACLEHFIEELKLKQQTKKKKKHLSI